MTDKITAQKCEKCQNWHVVWNFEPIEPKPSNLPKGDPNGQPHPIIASSCERDRKMAGRVRYARDKAVQFALKHRQIILNDRDEVIQCFGKYFSKWDKPETRTADSAKMYTCTIDCSEKT